MILFNKLIILILIITVFYNSIFFLGNSNYNIITQFGSIKKVEDNKGIYFKIPFIQNSNFINKNLKTINIKDTYITAERRYLNIESFVIFKIIDPIEYYKKAKNLMNILYDLVNQELKNLFAQLSMNDILKNGLNIDNIGINFGIQIVNFNLTKISFYDSVLESIYYRMISEVERQSNEYRAEGLEVASKIKANADKEKNIIITESLRTSKIIKSEGDAQKNQIIANFYDKSPEFYIFYTTMKLYQENIKDKDLILNYDNDFLKLIN